MLHSTFALGIVIVLMLGSGAVAVVLAVADAVILRPLPYHSPEALAVVSEMDPTHGGVVEISHRNYVDWRAQAKSFESLAAFGSVNWGQRLTGHGEPTEIPAAAVSASFFEVLGVAPHIGRALRDSDDRPKAAPVTVISYGLWQRIFGGDARVLGRVLMLEDRPVEIVGVMPREFDFPKGAQMWIPVIPPLDAVSPQIKADALEARWFGVLYVVGRLRSSSTPDHARVELDRINAEIDRQHGSRPPHVAVVTTLEQRLLGNTRPSLLLLMAAVALIVVIACANVTTLLLMRASRLQTETAVRLSLGAVRRHIFKLWLSETCVLFVLGAISGLILASLMLPLVVRLAPESVYRIGDARLTVSLVFVVLAAMAVASVVTAGLITALASLRVRLAGAVRESGVTATSSRMRTVRRLLVTGEVTVACVLLVGAGLTLRSFMNLRALDLGFTPNGVLTLDVAPSPKFSKDANRMFYTPVLERISALPDVIDAGGVFLRPLAFEAIGTDTRTLPDGNDVDDMSAWEKFSIPVNKETATPGYFTATRIPLRDGRYFSERDNESAPLVAIVSESAAKRLFPGQRAVGRRITAGGEDPGPDGKLPWRTIVGVVSDVRYRGLQDMRFDYYVPYRQMDDTVKHIVIRTRGNPLQSIAQIRSEIRQIDPLAVVEGVTTMDALVDRAVAPWRLNMVLFAVLGVMALAMAGVGVYGVVQYAVVERWHELGIRAALGASAHTLTTLIVSEGASLTAVGVALGIAAAWPLTKLMTSILFGVEPVDPLTFAGVVAALGIIASAASYFPARFAGQADPASLLRSRT